MECTVIHAFSRNAWPARNAILCLLIDKLASALVDSCKERKDNGEEQQRLSLGQGDAGLQSDLSERALACDTLSKEGSGESKLGHPSNEQLVLLQQWKP